LLLDRSNTVKDVKITRESREATDRVHDRAWDAFKVRFKLRSVSDRAKEIANGSVWKPRVVD
jgi:hypothetical protein